MSRFAPLDFQFNAIQKLTDTFINLWGKDENQRHLVFKSPTGSGKTFMVSSFIHGLNSLPNWNYEKAIIWITFSDDLAMQSKGKFREYFNTNLENKLITVQDFDQGALNNNDILFINWQKLVSKAAENRVLRRPDNFEFEKEQGYYFEDVIENTKKSGREILLVIDESHTHLSQLAQKSVVDVVNPKVIIHVSATPKPESIPGADEIEEGTAGYVSVKRSDVVSEGLIKEKIAVQTDEDLQKFQGRDLDELLIDLAIDRKKEIESEYSKLKKDINPLVLIQLPNDDQKLKDVGQKTKQEIVVDYLQKRGIDTDSKVALWFDGKQKNMDYITHNNSDVDFLLFKQAAGTGWDCPRAHILVMYREISSATFYTQTIGRILRSPEPHKKEDYKNSPILRTGYLYTNYKRNEVGIPDQSKYNKPYIYTSLKKNGITNVSIKSDYVPRVDYGDLGNSFKFQMSFLSSMDTFFDINDNELLESTRQKLSQKGLNLHPNVTNKLIIDAEFSDYDRLSLDFSKKGRDEDYEMSRNDVEKLFNYWCFKILSEQTDKKARISNVSRSWSPLKSALRVWFKRVLDLNSDYYYRVFISDVNKHQSSIFRRAVTKALIDYYPIKIKYLDDRKKQLEELEAPVFEIRDEYNFTEDFDELSSNEGTSELCAIQPFFLRKNYSGRNNELLFINYLENKQDFIEWWFKNGEGSKEYFCLKYYNTSTSKHSLFYPDWIVKFKDGRIGIFDTKGGFTAQNPDGRAKGLADKIIKLNLSNHDNEFIGGLVVLENNQWYLHENLSYKKISEDYNYSYVPGQMGKNWKPLENFFRPD